MENDRSTLLFFDASCLIAASGSPSGGSNYLLTLCAAGLLRGAVSALILLEAYRNILGKMGKSADLAFQELLSSTPLLVGGFPLKTELTRFSQFVDPKDAHVLVSCNNMKVDYLITLDKKLIFQLTASSMEIHALSPRDFIKTILPGLIETPPANPATP